MNFTKVFHKIVLLLYKSKWCLHWSYLSISCHIGYLDTDDVLTEQAILKWYHDAHLAKGKSVFLPQMKRMVDWLNTADEESDQGYMVLVYLCYCELHLWLFLQIL